jgi:YHS domain-containing protein
MKKCTIIIIAAIICTAFALGVAWAKPQETCPVMGGKINKSIYTDYDGKRVYFCCNACPEPFKKEPEKYIKKMEAEGVVLEKAPAVKPVPAPAKKAE